MNKKMSATLAVVSVLGATTAFAVNPFSDVTPNDWAYQAVSQLAAQGVIDGYPDGTFKGERNITRYEMAQMVARAMARQEMVDAEQQAQINRLANEFANELNSLGVRVDNLEKKIGNVKVTGDARVRWTDPGEKEDSFDMRARLQFNAAVAKNTTATARISTGNFGFNSKNKDGSDKEADLTIDRLFVTHKFDGFALTGGRYGEKFGQTGYWQNDAVDGVKADFKAGGFQAAVGYGTARAFDKPYADMAYGKLGIGVSGVGLNAFYMDFNGDKAAAESLDKAWGIGAAFKAAQFGISGDYVRVEKDKAKEFWMARIDLGKADLKKPGTWNLFVDYVDAEDGAYLKGSSALRGTDFLNNTKSWGVGTAIVVAKNTKLEAFRSFNAETQEGVDVEDMTKVQIVYKF